MTATGQVNARLEAILRLRLRGPAGAELEVTAVVDTGFTGSLTLPAATVAALGLVRRAGGTAVLADGTTLRFDTYAADLDWGGTSRGVVVSAVGTEALAGMGLLSGQELRVEVRAGGAVEVRPLPRGSIP